MKRSLKTSSPNYKRAKLRTLNSLNLFRGNFYPRKSNFLIKVATFNVNKMTRFEFVKTGPRIFLNSTNINQSSNKLCRIKQIPLLWASANRPTIREEVVLTRLRIGHTRLTHTHLINHLLSSSPPCPHCSTDVLTVEHIFSCPSHQSLGPSLQVPSSIVEALKNNADSVSLTLQYLRQSSLSSIHLYVISSFF